VNCLALDETCVVGASFLWVLQLNAFLRAIFLFSVYQLDYADDVIFCLGKNSEGLDSSSSPYESLLFFPPSSSSLHFLSPSPLSSIFNMPVPSLLLSS